MKHSLVFTILLVLLCSSSSPIQARNKARHPPAATPAPGPSNSDCTTIILSMMDCVNYLSLGSNDTKPIKTCCDGIETVLQYNPQCICVGLETSKEMGIPLNNTRTLAMPSTCNIPIAPPHCGVALPGASTPGLSPVSPSSGTPMSSPTSAESPSTSPSTAETPVVTAPSPSSSATNTNLSVSTLTLFLALIVSSIAYFSI